jgi:hypothetical protein
LSPSPYTKRLATLPVPSTSPIGRSWSWKRNPRHEGPVELLADPTSPAVDQVGDLVAARERHDQVDPDTGHSVSHGGAPPMPVGIVLALLGEVR